MAKISRLRTTTITIEDQPVALHVVRLPLEEAEAYRVRVKALFGDDDKTLTGDDAAFVRESITRYLSVKPGELSMDDEPVLTGAQLLDVIGENPGLVTRALLAIAGMTTVSRDESLPSASGPVSVPSSDAHQPAPDGLSPETTAASAAPAATAPTVAVTVETERPSFGSTETSS